MASFGLQGHSANRDETGMKMVLGWMQLFLLLRPCQEGWNRPTLSLFAKVFDVFSCNLLKVACFQKFLLTRHEFYGNLSQQFNITYFSK